VRPPTRLFLAGREKIDQHRYFIDGGDQRNQESEPRK